MLEDMSDTVKITLPRETVGDLWVALSRATSMLEQGAAAKSPLAFWNAAQEIAAANRALLNATLPIMQQAK